MAYGLRIKNDATILIIDSTYANWALWEHGEGVTTAYAGAYHEYNATVNFSTPTTEPPLIAIKPSSSVYCGVSRILKSGSNYTGFLLNSEINNPATVSWQAFVPRKDKSSEAYGLRVYDATPSLVFDSGHRPMVIADIDTTSPAPKGVATVTYPSDSNAYHIVSPDGFVYHMNFWNGYASDLRLWKPMLKTLSSSQVSFGGRNFFHVDNAIPVQVDWEEVIWPSVWTIITVKKAF